MYILINRLIVSLVVVSLLSFSFFKFARRYSLVALKVTELLSSVVSSLIVNSC